MCAFTIFEFYLIHNNNQMIKLKTEWENKVLQIKKSFEEEKRISILIHYNPDGDAVGSGLALMHFLRTFKHEVKLIAPNRFPAFLRWMPGSDEIIAYERHKEKVDDFLKTSDFIFCLDFNNSDRMEEIEDTFFSCNAHKVLIDHHPNPKSFCDSIFSDTKASSTAELVYHFIKLFQPDFRLNKDMATCIYVGLMTDTGNFSYNSSNPETFNVLAELLSFGIDKDEITSNIYDNFSENRMRLLGFALGERMKVIKNLKTAYIVLHQADLQKFNFKQGDSEGFVNYPLSIKGIVFSVLFIEYKDIVKVSLRSKGEFEVNKFAEKHFSGGGHQNAAGGSSKEKLSVLIQRFEKLLPLYENELNAE